MHYGPDRTRLVFPEGSFNAQIGSELFADVVAQLWGSAAKQEWLQLQQLCRELAAAAAVALHPVVVRYDPWVALTAAARHPLRFAKFITSKPPLLPDNVMFSQLVGSVVRSQPLLQFIDVLCQGTCGAPAAALPAAYMVRAFSQMYQPAALPAAYMVRAFSRCTSQVAATQPNDSFVHLHAVVDLPPDTHPSQLPVHSFFLAPGMVGDTGWPTLTIGTAVDVTLAPPDKQILHVYMAEPYAPWSGLARGSRQYQQLKQQRAEQLWGLIDQAS
ncbi:hypothetical protein OEZ86_007753 [Tetradesmus obliquus]|nr:hypothetical protein OEZ86_007753 [Tetradesmus obliquus]